MIDKPFLKNILARLNRYSFTKFIWHLWVDENISNNTRYRYINLTQLDNIGENTFEQVIIDYKDIERKNQGYNFIIPFYEPLELFENSEHIKFQNNSRILSSLKKYNLRLQERIDNWNIFIDGEYLIPQIAFVTNAAGFNFNFYQEKILPKLDELVRKSGITGLTKIGTCDSIVELSFQKTLKVFKEFISGNRDIVLSVNDNNPIVNHYTSEKYLTGGLLKCVNAPISSAYVQTISKDQILNEFEFLLKDISREREMELFLSKYFKQIFGDHFDKIETQLWLKCPDLDINSKDRRLDVFIRNSIENDWELLELKHICQPVRINQGIPVFKTKIYSAIEQLKNYGNLLKQDAIKTKLSKLGIDYFEPELKLVITKKPDINNQQWRWLKKNNENGIKIMTLDDIFAEVNLRYNSQISLLDDLSNANY